jgi:hypothetical protein
VGFESDLRFGRREFAGDYFILKAGPGMRSIAKRLILRLPAAAEADYRPATESEWLSDGIENFKIALNTD